MPISQSVGAGGGTNLVDAASFEVRDLEVGFARAGRVKPVVTGVSFSIRAGETLGLVGESGSGKTVTALASMGLIGHGDGAQVSGSVQLGGRELIGSSRKTLGQLRGADIAMIFQDPVASLNPALSIGEQIVETIRAHQKVSRAAARQRAIELIGRVGIPNPRARMRSYPHELSGGMCQRVMIAIALSCDPKVLIADEPTTALDVTVQAQVLDLLKSLQTEHGMAMLFITHDLAVIADCADRVAVMYSGEIVEIGDVMRLYAKPEHPYTEALLAATPHMLRQRAGGRGLADRLAIERRALSGCRFAPRCNYAVAACREETVELIPRGVSDAVRCLRASELVLSGTRSHVTLGET